MNSATTAATDTQRVSSIRRFFSWVKAATLVFRKEGFKGLIRVYGKKMVFYFFMFYLVRDLTLYVALPYLAAKGVLSFSN